MEEPGQCAGWVWTAHREWFHCQRYSPPPRTGSSEQRERTIARQGYLQSGLKVPAEGVGGGGSDRKTGDNLLLRATSDTRNRNTSAGVKGTTRQKS